MQRTGIVSRPSNLANQDFRTKNHRTIEKPVKPANSRFRHIESNLDRRDVKGSFSPAGPSQKDLNDSGTKGLRMNRHRTSEELQNFILTASRSSASPADNLIHPRKPADLVPDHITQIIIQKNYRERNKTLISSTTNTLQNTGSIQLSKEDENESHLDPKFTHSLDLGSQGHNE